MHAKVALVYFGFCESVPLSSPSFLPAPGYHGNSGGELRYGYADQADFLFL